MINNKSANIDAALGTMFIVAPVIFATHNLWDTTSLLLERRNLRRSTAEKRQHIDSQQSEVPIAREVSDEGAGFFQATAEIGAAVATRFAALTFLSSAYTAVLFSAKNSTVTVDMLAKNVITNVVTSTIAMVTNKAVSTDENINSEHTIRKESSLESISQLQKNKQERREERRACASALVSMFITYRSCNDAPLTDEFPGYVFVTTLACVPISFLYGGRDTSTAFTLSTIALGAASAYAISAPLKFKSI